MLTIFGWTERNGNRRSTTVEIDSNKWDFMLKDNGLSYVETIVIVGM